MGKKGISFWGIFIWSMMVSSLASMNNFVEEEQSDDVWSSFPSAFETYTDYLNNSGLTQGQIKKVMQSIQFQDIQMPLKPFSEYGEYQFLCNKMTVSHFSCLEKIWFIFRNKTPQTRVDIKIIQPHGKDNIRMANRTIIPLYVGNRFGVPTQEWHEYVIDGRNYINSSLSGNCLLFYINPESSIEIDLKQCNNQSTPLCFVHGTDYHLDFLKKKFKQDALTDVYFVSSTQHILRKGPYG